MPSKPIQAGAPGYLGLLGLKNNGQLPVSQADDVQPTFDMQEYYLQGRRLSLDSGATNVPSGGVGLLTPTNQMLVPDNEVWVILGGALYLGGAAAVVASAGVRVIVRSSYGQTAHRIISDQAAVGSPLAAAVALNTGIQIGVPVARAFLQPGDFIGFNVDWANGAGTLAATFRAIYAKFQA